MHRISALLAIAVLTATACGGTPAASPTPAATRAAASPTAQPFALSKPAEIVVQAAAGGGSDIFARKIADVLQKEKAVNQPVQVVNKPGGSGAVAYVYLKQKSPDPHYLGTVTVSYLSTALQQNAGYTYKDFSNLVTLAVDDFVATVKADSPYQTFKDLVQAAKDKPKQVKVAGTQLGSSDSIIPALVEQASGAKFNYIVFNSAGEANAAVLGGTVDWTVSNPGEALALLQGKKVRILAAFSPNRLKGIDAPTAKELGFDVTWDQFRGIVAPGGLTDGQRAYWEQALTKITKTSDWDKYMEENLLRPLVLTGTQVNEYLDRENGRIKQVLTALGVIK